jgi:RimJ/RimL family protein N-acetyltransferase
MKNYGYWAVREKSTGQYIGDVGFQENLRALGPIFDIYPEAGWVFDPKFQGFGYATEAMTAVLGWSEGHMKCQFTGCLIAPDNQASLNLSKKLGYRVIGDTLVQDEPTLILLRG